MELEQLRGELASWEREFREFSGRAATAADRRSDRVVARLVSRIAALESRQSRPPVRADSASHSLPPPKKRLSLRERRLQRRQQQQQQQREKQQQEQEKQQQQQEKQQQEQEKQQQLESAVRKMPSAFASSSQLEVRERETQRRRREFYEHAQQQDASVTSLTWSDDRKRPRGCPSKRRSGDATGAPSMSVVSHDWSNNRSNDRLNDRLNDRSDDQTVSVTDDTAISANDGANETTEPSSEKENSRPTKRRKQRQNFVRLDTRNGGYSRRRGACKGAGKRVSSFVSKFEFRKKKMAEHAKQWADAAYADLLDAERLDSVVKRRRQESQGQGYFEDDAVDLDESTGVDCFSNLAAFPSASMNTPDKPGPVSTCTESTSTCTDKAVGHTDVDRVLRESFRLSNWRPGQREAVTRVLDGEDLLVVLPTGAGKSLIYQVASVCLPGVTLVVSPLLALQRDQLAKLPAVLASRAALWNR
ncbi:MAG: hypothetical protein MHM6MM_008240 [Cercozoa sp. M6MM]